MPLPIAPLTENEIWTATPEPPSTDEAPSGVLPVLAAHETRTLILEWPESIRTGESGSLLLALAGEEGGFIAPTAKAEEREFSEKLIAVSSLYETHQLVVEARLDMTGPDISPQGTMSEALAPGQKAQFAWSISPKQPGVYRGVLWLYLNIRPKTGGEIVRRALLARPLEIESGNVLVFSARVVRWAGIVGMLAGAVLGSYYCRRGYCGLKSPWRK
ncbi:MAG: hypothetical protein IT308_06855 [Anaerolineaceae bacterium]|nr:hypothetical protein [Anaerolineaceae bacterium]